MENSFCYEGTKTLIRAVEIEPLENYCLRVSFSNEKVKVFDFKPHLDCPVFKPLRDKSFFSAVKTYRGTALWAYDWGRKNVANDIDIAPEALYWEGVSI
jgi:hypothetical protein